MQQIDPPTLHQCYDEYVFSNFYDGVTLTVQDLTETVGHSRNEKRFYHIMMEGTNAMNLMQALANDYLRTFYYPLQRIRDDYDRSLDLPEIDPDNLGWLPLLQGSLLASLTYYAQAEERSPKPLGGPTCTPQVIVIHPHRENKVLFVGIVPALHAPHEHDPKEEEEEEKEDDGQETRVTHTLDHLHNSDHLHVATTDSGQ